MKRYKRPTKEEFYEQFITLNKTNKQLSQYYGCSENVIHRWKNYYQMTKPIELVLKSYIHKGYPKGHPTWNKGLKGHLNSENCKKTWFKKEDILKKAKKSFGVPKIEHIGRDDKRLISLSDEIVYIKNKRNGKTYANHKRIGYAKWVLQQAGIEIPNGYVVYHIDGNYANNDIGNLEIISRGELCKRNHSASLLAKKDLKKGK